jgi:hypothetical protein
MRVPLIRLRLWLVMVTVAVTAIVTAELVRRRERLAHLCVAHHEQASDCLGENKIVCKFGETTESIEALYRRLGPNAWCDYQASVFHSKLANQYDEAANRWWFPMLAHLPPLDGFTRREALAEWRLEALLETTPLFGMLVMMLTVREEIAKLKRLRASQVSTRRAG